MVWPIARTGLRLASASEDQSVRVWDVRTGQPLLNLTGHQDGVSSRGLQPGWPVPRHGRRGWNGADLGRGDRESDPGVARSRGDVSWLAFSPDGRRLVSASYDTTVRVWDPVTGQEALTLRDHTRGVLAVAFSPDGRHLASAGFAKGDAAVRVWNATPLTDDGSQKPCGVFAGHTQDVNCVAFSPNGSLLASGSDDKTVQVRDATTGQVVHTLVGQARVTAWPSVPTGPISPPAMPMDSSRSGTFGPARPFSPASSPLLLPE